MRQRLVNEIVLLVVGFWFLAGAVWGLTVPMPQGGFADVEAYRAVFFHVPLAWTGCLAFLAAAVQGGLYLWNRRPLTDASAYALAETGLVLTFLATATGSVFARTQWGSWWNWDPRQTSILFVMLIYAGYLLLRQALPEDESLRARAGAAYLLLAVAPMMWLVMVFPRLQPGSLHPQKAPFEAVHWRVMLFNFVGLIALLAWLVRFQVQTARIALAARERWR